jgi:predicted lipid-binding transport protein (Tim44 family)
MRHSHPRLAASVLAAAFAAALALAPAAADARAGAGGSFGSRGTQTWSAPPSTSTAPSVSPFQRSLTPNAPSYGQPSPSYAPGYASGYGARSPFASGLLGGLVGVGLGGLLFGHGLFGGFHGIGSLFGFVLQMLLLFWIGRWLWRTFANGQPALAGGPGFFARQGYGPQPVGGGAAPRGSARQRIALTPADYAQFEQLLKAVQAAWSAHDTAALQQLATPEMVGVFSEQLAEQASRGVRNTVNDVTLQQGDLSEAWSERGRDYATVAMRFSMIDVTRDQSGRVVDGSLTEHVTATEVWTFLRSQGGRWVLSAIQQAR